MSEGTEDWGDLDNLPRGRRFTGLFCCGLGCIIPTILIVAVLGWGVSVFNKGLKSNVHWARVHELMPFEERPEGAELIFGFEAGLMSWLIDEQVYVFRYPPLEEGAPELFMILLVTGDAIAPMFDASIEGIDPYLRTSESGEEELVESIQVQGVDLPVVLFPPGSEPFPVPQGPEEGSGPVNTGPVLAVNISEGVRGRQAALWCYSDDPDPATMEPRIIRFLEAFDLGGDSTSGDGTPAGAGEDDE